jgi:hypothetical protein
MLLIGVYVAVILLSVGLILYFHQHPPGAISSPKPAQPIEPSSEIFAITEDARTHTYKCGHDGPRRYSLNVFGEEIELADAWFTRGSQCDRCCVAGLLIDTVHCCLCGLGIPVGAPVSLVSSSPDIKKDLATRIDGYYLACLRWDCCDSGALMVGHWQGKEIKYLFPSGGSIAGRAFETGNAVFGDADGNIREIKLPKDE